MPNDKSYPVDLARFVQKQIKRRFDDVPGSVPSLENLISLFETLYFASFKTEEGQPIVCHVIWLDPNNPDPNPPRRIRSQYSGYIPLANPLAFNISNLVKLSKATDPRTSSLTVFPDDAGLNIYGFIDQGNHHYASLNYEQSAAIGRPGLFQASIFGPAHVIAQFEYIKIAELKIDTLVTDSFDVLHRGPICQKLNSGMDQFIDEIAEQVPPANLNSPFLGAITRGTTSTRAWDWRTSSKLEWIRTLCRILIRLQSYRHGGAVLITPDCATHLNVKYDINYTRLNKALQKWSIEEITRVIASRKIRFDHLQVGNRTIPADLYLTEACADNDLEDINAEIDAVIWYISLLSRVDGLILLNPMLEVKGFGTIINGVNDIETVYLAGDEAASGDKLIELDYNHFGTRHRSMMSYCSCVEDAVGFVVSQDGDVRAITRIGDKVVIWDNIRIRDEQFARRMSVGELRRYR